MAASDGDTESEGIMTAASDPQPGELRERKPEYPPFDSAPVDLPNGGVVQTTEVKDLQQVNEVN